MDTKPRYINADGWVVELMPDHNLEGYITFHTWPTGLPCRLLPHEFWGIFKEVRVVGRMERKETLCGGA